jgi:hypothetical protein
MRNEQLALQAAGAVLEALETPIAGRPSVQVLDRGNAIRLIKAALLGVFEGVENPDDSLPGVDPQQYLPGGY